MGSEQGLVVSCDRKAKKDADSVKRCWTSSLRAGRHHGPIYSIERNYVAPKYYLTVGDWTAKVWTEDCATPIMQTKYDKSYLTAGCWSPTRPGVFFTTKEDGTLDVWDYHFKQNDPTFSTKIGDSGLRSIRVEKGGSLVAVGSEDGTTTVLKMSRSISHSLYSDEKATIVSMLEREFDCERAIELREKSRLKAQKRKNTKKADPVVPPEDPKLQAKLDLVTKEFYKALGMEEPQQAPVEKTKEKAPQEKEKTSS